MANLIKAKVFTGNNIPSKTFISNLVVTGGSDKILKHLESRGWNGKEPVCTPVFSISEGDAAIKASRWLLGGGLEKPIKLKADNLLGGAEKNLVISIPMLDLSVFEFNTTNASYWIDSEDITGITVTDRQTKNTLDQEEAEARGVKSFCVRVFLLPETPVSALLWLALVPMTKAELKAKLPSHYNATNCPQVPVALGHGSSRARRIVMMTPEKDRDNFGLGCLPVLEALYPGSPTLPDPKDLKEAVFTFMRRVGGHNNRGANTIMNALDTQSEVAKSDPLPHLWPALAVDNNDSDDGEKPFCYLPNSVNLY